MTDKQVGTVIARSVKACAGAATACPDENRDGYPIHKFQDKFEYLLWVARLRQPRAVNKAA